MQAFDAAQALTNHIPRELDAAIEEFQRRHHAQEDSQQQTLALAYFWVLAVVALLLVPLVLLMRRPVVGEGRHIGAE